MIAFFAAATAKRGLAAIGATHFEDVVDEAVVGQDRLDQTDAECLVRHHDAARQDQVGAASGADEARQALGAARAGDDADVYLGLAEVRRRRGHPQRARQRELAATAPRLAVDGGHHRLRQRLDEPQGAGPAARVALGRLAGGQLGEVVEVGVGDEVPGRRRSAPRSRPRRGQVGQQRLELAHGREAHVALRGGRNVATATSPCCVRVPSRHGQTLG